LPRSRLPYCGHAIERSRQPDLGDDQRKGFRFDPAQGGTSISDRRHREPLFCKDLSDQGPRSLIAVKTRISPCTGFIANSLHEMSDCRETTIT
jgi:hypothetical protein